MENAPGCCGNFDVGVKHKLFQNFRRFKENNSVSKNDNALTISSVEVQLLQGISIDNKAINDINIVLQKHLQNRTLYNKFTDDYRINNPYAFFQEGLNLYFKDTANDRGSFYDSSRIYIAKIKDSIYITSDDSYGHCCYTFETSMLDITKEMKNKYYYEFILHLYALAEKTGYIQDYTNQQTFEMVKEDLVPPEDEKCREDWNTYSELDEDDILHNIAEFDSYENGHYNDLYNLIKKYSKKSRKHILDKITELSLKFTGELRNDGLKIVNIYNSINKKHLSFLYQFQNMIYDIIDINEDKYSDKHSHIIEFNCFLYDSNGRIEENINQYDQNTFNEVWYHPYYIPTCFSEDGSEVEYDVVLKSLLEIFDTIINVIRTIYEEYEKKDWKNIILEENA
jgi:hypothetical protein